MKEETDGLAGDKALHDDDLMYMKVIAFPSLHVFSLSDV